MVESICKDCGKELNYKANRCLDCSKKKLQESFREHPELKQAYKEALEDTFSPENRKKMADNIMRFCEAIQVLQGGNRNDKC